MRRRNDRRSFLKQVAGLPIIAPFVSRMPQSSAGARKFDPKFAPAHEAVRALREGVISSRELTGLVYERIKKHNPRINAFVTLVEQHALEKARQADEALATGNSLGRLHGLPILIKDVFQTAGIRTTCGSLQLENYVPKEDAVAVARLRAAGAILIGKTNLPEFASDLQSYNKIAGTSNNPWDLTRTPGGSTGGGAAAIATGLGFLELGSDIGGSIRTPCHFCGIYGLKPTLNLVPMDGHIPPEPGAVLAIPDLPVAGPMARSARDLILQLEVMAGPRPRDSIAYRWNLPSARGNKLKDYRIGYVLDDSFCPVGSETKKVLSGAIDALRKAGVELVEGWPKGFRVQEAFETYFPLLAAVVGTSMRPEEIKLIRDLTKSSSEEYARLWIQGVDASHRQWMGWSEARIRSRALWQDYFRSHDAFLMPANIVPAFSHNQKLTFFERTVTTPEGKRPYADMLRWITVATLTGCPAVVAPVGRTQGNLPVGIQIMGPYLEDATPIDIAGRIGDIVGGYEPPPGFN